MTKSRAFQELGRWIDTAVVHLPLSLAERALFHLVLSRTVRWNKLTERMTDAFIADSTNLKTRTLYFPYSFKTYEKARKGLVDRNLVFIKGTPGNRVYTLNAPWIISFVVGEYLKKRPNDLGACGSHFSELMEIMEEHMPEELRGRTSLAEVFITVKEEKKQEAAEVMSKPLIASRVLPVIDKLVSDFNAEGNNLKHIKINTKKVKGNIKHWLNECEQTGIDPKEELRDVVEYWTRLAPQITNRFGKKVNPVPHAVSFEQFYAIRAQVRAWLHERKQQEGQFTQEDGDGVNTFSNVKERIEHDRKKGLVSS